MTLIQLWSTTSFSSERHLQYCYWAIHWYSFSFKSETLWPLFTSDFDKPNKTFIAENPRPKRTCYLLMKRISFWVYLIALHNFFLRILVSFQRSQKCMCSKCTLFSHTLCWLFVSRSYLSLFILTRIWEYRSTLKTDKVYWISINSHLTTSDDLVF